MQAGNTILLHVPNFVKTNLNRDVTFPVTTISDVHFRTLARVTYPQTPGIYLKWNPNRKHRMYISVSVTVTRL